MKKYHTFDNLQKRSPDYIYSCMFCESLFGLNEKGDLTFEQRKKKRIGVSHQVHYDKNELVYDIGPTADTLR